jgi:hypothetical protein
MFAFCSIGSGVGTVVAFFALAERVEDRGEFQFEAEQRRMGESFVAREASFRSGVDRDDDGCLSFGLTFCTARPAIHSKAGLPSGTTISVRISRDPITPGDGVIVMLALRHPELVEGSG